MSITELTVQEAAAAMRDNPSTSLIDVRSPTEFSEGCAVSAVNIPLEYVSRKSLEEKLGSLEGRALAVICQHGVRSLYACEALIEDGLTNVFSIQGGTDAWELAGLPMNYPKSI